MNISKRFNFVFGRLCDSWTRVIDGKLFLFCHSHSPTYGGNTRKDMSSRAVIVFEVEWDDFEKLAERAKFTYKQTREIGSTRRHSFVKDA
jgi:hypothetical protein